MMETERAFIVRKTDGKVVAHVYQLSGQDTRRRTSYYTCGTKESAKTLVRFLTKDKRSHWVVTLTDGVDLMV